MYNLPDRDCSAKASDGEIKLGQDGANKYKDFINSKCSQTHYEPGRLILTYCTEVAKELSTKQAKELSFALILEPDSLANLVTNMGVAKCAGAATAYKEGVAYAIKKLQFPNVAIYLDAAHGGWLGWDDNLAPTAKLFAEVLAIANTGATTPAKIRGFATNVSNYNCKNTLVRSLNCLC